MNNLDRSTAMQRIAEMPKEQVLKVLIFMAGMEAGSQTGGTEQTAKENKCEQAS